MTQRAGRAPGGQWRASGNAKKLVCQDAAERVVQRKICQRRAMLRLPNNSLRPSSRLRRECHALRQSGAGTGIDQQCTPWGRLHCKPDNPNSNPPSGRAIGFVHSRGSVAPAVPHIWAGKEVGHFGNRAIAGADITFDALIERVIDRVPRDCVHGYPLLHSRCRGCGGDGYAFQTAFRIPSAWASTPPAAQRFLRSRCCAINRLPLLVDIDPAAKDGVSLFVQKAIGTTAADPVAWSTAG